MVDITKSLTTPEQPVRAAMAAIESSPGKIALVVAADGRLLGTVTDGDIRRALLNRTGLDEPISKVMNAKPRSVTLKDDTSQILATMRRDKLHHLPVVDGAGRLVGLETLDELLQAERRDNWVVIMAGGEGRRLRPLTESTPKPMLPVGAKPILETILDNFIEAGFDKFFLSVNYRADLIKDYFGDGSKRGIAITYLHEETALGTAGSLCLLPERPRRPFIVMNGDILTNVRFPAILDFHHQHDAIGTMCVREYRYQVPYGVVTANDHLLSAIHEKPEHVQLVNAGIYVLNPEALDFIPKGEVLQMPQLFQKFMDATRRCTLFPIREYWLDIGRHADLQQANLDVPGI